MRDNMDNIKIINLTPENIGDYGVCGYKDVKKHLELRKKIEWFKQHYPKGLRIKVILSKKGGYQGYFPIGRLAKGKVVTVPKKSYFMLGDNSSASADSRYWGFAPLNLIKGRAWCVYLPIKRMRMIK